MEMINLYDIGKFLRKHEAIGTQQTCNVGSILILQSNIERLNDLSKVIWLIMPDQNFLVYQ